MSTDAELDLSPASRTIVVKVGTSTLTDEEGRLDREFLPVLANQLCDLTDQGHHLVLVTSGAVRAGAELLGWSARPKKIALKQAAASVGQGRLMAAYAEAFGARGRLVGQILLTRQLAQDRGRYLNAQNTLQALLKNGVTPIVNENDTVAVEELQFGDNDTLGALVAALVGADLLLLLTNVDGLLDDTGAVIPVVPYLDRHVRELAGGAGEHGSGGMATKVQAAEIAGAAGIPTVIARGRRENVVRDAAEGDDLGTRFTPSTQPLKGRKHWLAYGIQPRGALQVNEFAYRAVAFERRSLLPAGVTSVTGQFVAGECVSVLGPDGAEFARGLVTCDAREAELVKGKRTDDSPTRGARGARSELVNRDDLVLLPSA